MQKLVDLREWVDENYDPANDIGNPYQSLLDSDEDDIEEDIRLGLSVHDMTLGLKRKTPRAS